jgi:serine/threonine protein kinase
MSQLAHPRIVEVYDYGVDADGPYYTMEILAGGDLNQVVPVPYRRLCEIARAVCSALSLLHSRRYPAETATHVSTAAYELGDAVGMFLEDDQ